MFTRPVLTNSSWNRGNLAGAFALAVFHLRRVSGVALYLLVVEGGGHRTASDRHRRVRHTPDNNRLRSAGLRVQPAVNLCRCGLFRRRRQVLTRRSQASIMRRMEQAEEERAIEFHRRFWAMQAVERPILRVRPHQPLGFGGHSGRYLRWLSEGDIIEPDHLTFEAVLGDEPPSSLEGPFFDGMQLPGLCWTEGLLGCPIRMETGGPWAEAFLAERAQIVERCRRGGPADDDPWLSPFRKGTALLAERANARFPVIQPLMRGPLDMMAAALGHEAMATAFYDDAELAHELLSLCTGIFVALARQHLSLAPAFRGGDVTFGLWAPGRTIRTQLDNAVLLSPRLYQDFFLPYDSRVFGSFDFVVMHVHSGCLHIIDSLLSDPKLAAIQVSIDFPGGPLLSEIMPTLRRIQGRKPLIVTGPATDEDIDLVRTSLPPAGVALDLERVPGPG